MKTESSNHLIWFGPLLSVAGLFSYFGYFAYIPAFRDGAYLNLVLVAAGMGLSLFGVLRARRLKSSRWVRWPGFLGLALSLLSCTMLFAYVYYLSYQLPPAQAATLELAELPEVTLVDQHGNQVAIHERQGRNLILTFYRGYW